MGTEAASRGNGAIVATAVRVSEPEVAAAQTLLNTAIAHGDCATCERLFGPDCCLIRGGQGGSIEVVLRAAWLEEIARDPHAVVEVTDRVVSVHGDIAVATLLVGSADAPTFVTDVFVKAADGRWTLAERHAA